MRAYIICYFAGPNNAEGVQVKARLNELVGELWAGRLQLDGTWIVSFDSSSDQIRDRLAPLLPKGNSLIVVGAAADAAWAGFGASESEWLVEHI